MYKLVTYQNSVLSLIDMDRHEDITPALTHAQVLAILEQVQAQPAYQARLADGPSFGYTGSLDELPPPQPGVPELRKVPLDHVGAAACVLCDPENESLMALLHREAVRRGDERERHVNPITTTAQLFARLGWEIPMLGLDPSEA